MMPIGKKFFIFHDHQLLLINNNDQYIIPDDIHDAEQAIAIGFFNAHACYLIERDAATTETINHQWVSVRKAVDYLGTDWFNVLARAYQLLLWNKNHRYCGRCGGVAKLGADKLERRCDQCHLSFFPKISPAIIVRIQKGNQILLARKADFPTGAYGLIAGFVEPGESIEETVHREVYEEVGLIVKNIQYVGSQPWPFPDSLMLAFTAEHVSGEISLNDGELAEAGWYDVDHLPGFPSSSISIARQLIDAFVKAYK